MEGRKILVEYSLYTMRSAVSTGRGNGEIGIFFHMKIYENINCIYLTANYKGRVYAINLKITVPIEHRREKTSIKYYEYTMRDDAATAGHRG